MVVLAVIAVLAAIALPSLANVLAAQRLRAAGTDLVSSLLIARSEAIKRKTRRSRWRRLPPRLDVRLARCDCRHGRTDRPREPPGVRVAVALAPANIVYERTGRLTVVGTTQVEFRDGERKAGIEAFAGVCRSTRAACRDSKLGAAGEPHPHARPSAHDARLHAARGAGRAGRAGVRAALACTRDRPLLAGGDGGLSADGGDDGRRGARRSDPQQSEAAAQYVDDYAPGSTIEDCTAIDAADVVGRDKCEVRNRLRGADVFDAAKAIGAPIAARACVVSTAPNLYVVAVAWQGLLPTDAPDSPCGENAFGSDNEENRRVYSTIFQVATLGV